MELTMLKPEDFAADAPWVAEQDVSHAAHPVPQIEGVKAQLLTVRSDPRGRLAELLTQRDGPIDSIVHVYAVNAEPQSVRAWVYHKHQSDRLAFTQGQLRVVLYDIRPDSPTCGKLDVLEVGIQNPTLVTIPPFVVHGVENYGDEAVTFINMPTKPYLPSCPDKWRLPVDDTRIPYSFAKQ